jgi:la-related protein 1
VSPWGNTSSSSDGTKRNWQVAENAIAKEPPLGVNTSPKEKAGPTPKVKSTGKEKWVKYDAEIIISSTTGTNSQNKKKNSNNGNSGNNNNGNGNNNTGKKKQNNNGNKNQNHKKDQKYKKQNNDNKNQNNNNNSSEKKKSNSNDRKAEAKSTDYVATQVTDAVAKLSIENKASKEVVVSSSTKPAVISVTKVKSEPADIVGTKTVSNASNGESNGESKLADSQEGSNPVNGQQNGYKKNNFQHRNSEPYTPGSSNATTHKRRYNSSNNKGFNPRNPIGGFNNMPIMNPGFSNYYMPMMPSMYGYNQFGTSFVPPPPTGPGSRSNSHSPVREDFVSLNTQPSMGPIPTEANAIPQFIPQQVMYNPYPQDLNSLILETVSYYFSDVNLAKDIFLRRHMNSNGFVPLSILIGFNKLKNLTGGDMNLLLGALGNYPELEVSNDKVRRAHNWQLWIIAYEKRLPAGQQEDDGVFEKENKENAFPHVS